MANGNIDDIKRDFNDLAFWNTDISVEPAVFTVGTKGRDVNGNWRYNLISTDGAPLVRSDDAGLMRVSALGVSLSLSGGSFSSSPLSADSSTVSAKQEDATNLHVSAFSNDAGLMRVSSIGTGSFAPLSADSSNVSAVQADASLLHVSAAQGDAGLMRVSADVPTTTATLGDGFGNTSIRFPSNLATNQINHRPFNYYFNSASWDRTRGDVSGAWVQAKDAGFLRSSAIIDSGSVSAKNPDATNLMVSAHNSDAGLMHVSAYPAGVGVQPANADNYNVSNIGAIGLGFNYVYDAPNGVWARMRGDVSGSNVQAVDAGFLRTSAIQGDATNLMISARSDDASKFRVYVVSGSAGGVSANQSLSALGLEGTAHIGQVSATLVDDGVITRFLGRVSALGVTVTTSPLSADSSSISAKQQDAANLRISAFSDDASKFRVYVVSGSAGGVSANQSLSALALEGTAHIGQVSATLVDDGSITKFLGRVSALGVSVATTPLSADSSSISAKSNDAGLMLVSAKQDDAGLLRVSSLWAQRLDATNDIVSARSDDAALFRVSAFSDDASKFRVYVVSGSAGGVSANQSLSALALEGTAHIGQVSATLVDDGSTTKFLGRVSAIGVSVTTSPLSADSSSISAVQADAGLFMVSAKSNDGALLRVSAGATTTTQTLVDGNTNASVVLPSNLAANAIHQKAYNFQFNGTSWDRGRGDVSGAWVKTLDAGFLRTSAFLDSGSVSAKQSDAVNLNVSAKSLAAATMLVSASQGSAEQLRVSAILAAGVSSVGAASFGVSAAQNDAGALHASAYSGTATQFVVSAAQADATLLRVSADIFANTVGRLTVYNSVSVSSIASVKSTAGAIYGYYAWNSDTKYNYIKLYNLSAGAQIGTDTPVLVVALPASAAANVEYPHGLAGFTAGIMVGATSAVAHAATTLSPTSAVGLQLFYA